MPGAENLRVNCRPGVQTKNRRDVHIFSCPNCPPERSPPFQEQRNLFDDVHVNSENKDGRKSLKSVQVIRVHLEWYIFIYNSDTTRQLFVLILIMFVLRARHT
ncbi:hypothetical protein AHF37_10229 [Paragonimus kellicotti]|nr:hypothetical protein AHF37_10229 [Paragonimus kellicotti]